MLDFVPDASAADNTAVADATAVADTTANAAAAATTAVAMDDSGAAVTGGLSIIADVAAAADPWSLNANGTVRKPAVCRKVKSRQVKPAVNAILRAGSIDAQAALLCAAADHTSLSAVCELARISTLKEQAAQKFVCKQSARMMKRNRAAQKLRTNVTSKSA